MAGFRKELFNQIITLIVGAFSFVAALAWNTAIQQFINTIVPVGDQLIYKFITAVIITVIAVVIIFVLTKLKKIKTKFL